MDIVDLCSDSDEDCRPPPAAPPPAAPPPAAPPPPPQPAPQQAAHDSDSDDSLLGFSSGLAWKARAARRSEADSDVVDLTGASPPRAPVNDGGAAKEHLKRPPPPPPDFFDDAPDDPEEAKRQKKQKKAEERAAEKARKTAREAAARCAAGRGGASDLGLRLSPRFRERQPALAAALLEEAGYAAVDAPPAGPCRRFLRDSCACLEWYARDKLGERPWAPARHCLVIADLIKGSLEGAAAACEALARRLEDEAPFDFFGAPRARTVCVVAVLVASDRPPEQRWVVDLERRLPRRLLARIVRVPRSGAGKETKAVAELLNLVNGQREAIAGVLAGGSAAAPTLGFLHGLGVDDVKKWDGAKPTHAAKAWPAALKVFAPPNAAEAVAAAYPSYDALARAFRDRGPGAVADLETNTAQRARVGPAASRKLHDALTATDGAFVAR